MTEDKIIKCPICKFEKAENLLDLNCGSLGDSVFSHSVKIEACLKCGHIYNGLSSVEIAGLAKYYNKESAPLNLSATDKSGDRPGSDSPFALQRYSQLYSLISSYIHNDFRVLDVGCAAGSFLDYLHKQGLNKLYGIDIVEDYVNYAKKKNDNIKLGNAELIPFNDNSFDLLVADQVMEHLADPIQAFREAKRVLNINGLLCLGIPDALRYSEIYFFDFYWFLIKEHIQHFDIEHLKLLASLEGFELVTYSKSDAPIMSEKMILPNMNIIFRLTNKMGGLTISDSCFKLKKEIEKYIIYNYEKLKIKRKILNDLAATQRPLYAWGIGREFLFLFEAAGLKKCNLVGLIDSNPYKQETYAIDGKKITDKNILRFATPDSVLVISAMAHIDLIKSLLKEAGFNGEVLKF